MKIDVLVPTKNNEETLEGCLNSIYENIPVNRVVVVDGYSTDGTMEIVREFNEKYGNVLSIQDKRTRTRQGARQTAIEQVETEWFMFVDSDVILCDKWFDKAKRFMRDDVDAIWGIEIWSTIKNPMVLRWYKPITLKIFEIRGGTQDLLVRHEAVKDIHIPHYLDTFEDAYIHDWLIKKGCKVVGTYDPYCIHLRPRYGWGDDASRTLKTGINLAITEIRCGLLNKYSKAIPLYGFYAAYFAYQLLRSIR